MRTSEWIALGYLMYLSAVAAVRPLPARRRRLLLVAAATLAAAIVAISRSASPPAAFTRDWILPPACILIGYWLSGLFFVRPMPRVEAALLEIDERLGIPSLASRLPRVLDEYFEAAYLAAYPMIPAGFAALFMSAGPRAADPFWSVVLLSDFLCFAALPWIQTRPPRAIESGSPPAACRLRRVNLFVLQRGSIQVNTFPSGHAAEAVAIPLALWSAGTAAAPLFALLGASIIGGAVIGRYHYAADTAAGALVAAAVWSVLG